VASTKYSDLFPYVLTELVGVSSLQAEAHIRAAVIDFCRRSKVWSFEDDPANTVPYGRTYDIVPPSGTAIVELKTIYANGELLDASTDVPDVTSDPGVPKAFSQSSPEAYSLWPTPDAAYPVVVTMTLAPSRASATFPAWIAEKYHDAIVAGAKSRLMAMPGQLWTNVQQAMFYRSICDTGVADAQAEASKGFTRATVRTTPHY
jgi:hypothetical protein